MSGARNIIQVIWFSRPPDQELRDPARAPASVLLSETETGADRRASRCFLKLADRNDCGTMYAGARLTASTRGRARGCSSVALPRIGDAPAATSAMLARPPRAPPRALESGEGNACCNIARKAPCCNIAREAIPIFGDATARAGDATFPTTTMLATCARASETGEGGAGSGRDDAAMANVVCISLGKRDREDMVYT